MDQRVFSRQYTWSYESGAVIIYLQPTPLGGKHSDALAGQLGAGQFVVVSKEYRDSTNFVFLQDYQSIPPSICLRNSTNCGQGNVPLYAILAESVEDVQVIESLLSFKVPTRIDINKDRHRFFKRSQPPTGG